MIVGYSFLFAFLISRGSFFRCPGLSLKQLQVAFGIKIAAGLVLGYIYTYHYPDRLKADTLKFFDDSKVIFDLLKTHPIQFLKIFTGIDAASPELTPTYMQLNSWMYEEFLNSNRMMIRIDILFRFLIPGNFYFVHVIFINFLSFTGLVYLYRMFAQSTGLNRTLLYLLIFFPPSLLFWGSGLLKESVLLLALGGFLYHYCLFMKNPKEIRRLLPMLFFGLLMFFIKTYMPLVLAAPLLAYCSVVRFPGRILARYVASIFVFFMILLNANLVFPRFDLSHYLYIKQRDFLALVKTEKPASAISIPVLEPSFGSILKNAPRGFITALTRPYIGESKSPFILLASAENFLILVLLLLCILFFKKAPPEEINFLALCLSMVVILFVLIGMITPIEGAIVRYKCVALPFLFVPLFIMTDWDKLKSKIMPAR